MSGARKVVVLNVRMVIINLLVAAGEECRQPSMLHPLMYLTWLLAVRDPVLAVADMAAAEMMDYYIQQYGLALVAVVALQ
jgi:hypothetical protein